VAAGDLEADGMVREGIDWPMRPACPIPPPLRGVERHTFTYFSIVERLPRIVRQVLASNDYPAAVVARLEGLIAAIPEEPIRLLRDASAPDTEEWVGYVAPYLEHNWLEVPWFFAETYFYRRVLEATGYFGRADGDDHDPFRALKLESLTAHVEVIHRQAARLETARDGGWVEGVQPWLELSLWGNQGDLSMWPGGAAEQPDEVGAAAARDSFVVVDDSAAVAARLAPGGGQRVDFIVDNCGLELVADLMLVDFLLASDSAREIWLHVKSHPLFVSDALARDVRNTVAALAGSDDAPTRALGERLREALQSEQVHVRPHRFWTSPLPGWKMPADLRAVLGEADLVISKGDANYRRLLGDRHWSFSAPLAAILAYFPAPLLLLRTLKSHVGAGIPPERMAAAQARDAAWTVSGRWGLVQMVG
jgi:uncharacterized protein with ATP-grasp and redox domains